MARGIVAKLGYGSAVAANGIEALEALELRGYDAVLMDCHMPETDGSQATAEIRRREAGRRHVPIIALTAAALVLVETGEKYIAAGMDDYLTKPVRAQELEAALDRWLAHAQLGRNHDTGDGGPDDGDGELDAAQFDGLRQLAEASGDPRVLRSIVEQYLDQAALTLAALRDAAGRGDAAAIREMGHDLKGSSATMSASAVESACAALEEAAARERWQGPRACSSAYPGSGPVVPFIRDSVVPQVYPAACVVARRHCLPSRRRLPPCRGSSSLPTQRCSHVPSDGGRHRGVAVPRSFIRSEIPDGATLRGQGGDHCTIGRAGPPHRALSVRIIRLYTDAGVVPPSGRTTAGYRLYDAEALTRVETAWTLRDLGLDLETVTRILTVSRPGDVVAVRTDAHDAQTRIVRVRSLHAADGGQAHLDTGDHEAQPSSGSRGFATDCRQAPRGQAVPRYRVETLEGPSRSLDRGR